MKVYEYPRSPLIAIVSDVYAQAVTINITHKLYEEHVEF